MKEDKRSLTFRPARAEFRVVVSLLRNTARALVCVTYKRAFCALQGSVRQQDHRDFQRAV